ncbi:hypothetical protein Anapl_17735 [Anas platyrhynchos]|uniref:Uncharacterized protein n=1 Tax=Anas platyrhynchos TaxID=8839 RepID=R0JHQ4_ANAPL|nr:hypothetical protein Anapl_17735 [Anas platyrhynchos]
MRVLSLLLLLGLCCLWARLVAPGPRHAAGLGHSCLSPETLRTPAAPGCTATEQWERMLGSTAARCRQPLEALLLLEARARQLDEELNRRGSPVPKKRKGRPPGQSLSNDRGVSGMAAWKLKVSEPVRRDGPKSSRDGRNKRAALHQASPPL